MGLRGNGLDATRSYDADWNGGARCECRWMRSSMRADREDLGFQMQITRFGRSSRRRGRRDRTSWARRSSGLGCCSFWGCCGRLTGPLDSDVEEPSSATELLVGGKRRLETGRVRDREDYRDIAGTVEGMAWWYTAWCTRRSGGRSRQRERV